MNEITTSPGADPGVSMSTMALLTNPASMQSLVTFSEMMAKSVVAVPNHLRGKPADCLAIVMQAARWGMDPFAVAQKTHLVNGALGYEAQLILAVLQSTRAIVGAPIYDYRGSAPVVEARVGMILAGESEPRWTQWLSSADVTTKNSPLWKTNVSQQMGYLQVKNWARQFAPGAILGIRTQDELEDIPAPAERDMGAADVVTPAGPRRRSDAAAPVPALAPATVIDGATGEIVAPAPSDPPPPAQHQSAGSAAGSLTGGQVAYLRNKLRAGGIEEAVILNRFEVGSLELLSTDQFAAIKAELLAAA